MKRHQRTLSVFILLTILPGIMGAVHTVNHPPQKKVIHKQNVVAKKRLPKTVHKPAHRIAAKKNVKPVNKPVQRIATKKVIKRTYIPIHKVAVKKPSRLVHKPVTKVVHKQKHRVYQRIARRPIHKPAVRHGASNSRFSALVIDTSTGKVLYKKNAANPRYPASLTKMMTLYLTFEALKSGRLHLKDRLLVMKNAAAQPRTNISLRTGDRLSVQKAIESIVVRSADDSSVVLAEALGGTVQHFAEPMNQKAKALGMNHTVFRNPHGLPDSNQHTTAYDMARLGIALRRDFPEYYDYFKRDRFSYNGVHYTGHNRVMRRFPGVDGIKTGYIRASGFNLVTHVKKDNHDVVAVIMGGTSAQSRDNAMIALLKRTFARFGSKQSKTKDGKERSVN